MTQKSSLPSIESELVAAPRQKLDLKNLKSRELMPDEAVEANSHVIGQKWGASTQLPAGTPPETQTPFASIRGYIPQYLDDELTVKAAEHRVTKTYLIIEALAKVGYHVDEADLVPDRRRSRQKGKV